MLVSRIFSGTKTIEHYTIGAIRAKLTFEYCGPLKYLKSEFYSKLIMNVKKKKGKMSL